MRVFSIGMGFLFILGFFSRNPGTPAHATAFENDDRGFFTSKSLPEPAHPTVQTGLESNIKAIPGGEKILSYVWLGSSDFLVFRDTQRTGAIRKNGQTGQETPLPELSGLLKESLGSPDDVNIITGVSADGKWCLWWPISNKKFFAATLDGKRKCSWDRPATFVSPRWLHEGHRWFLSQESKVLFSSAEGSSPEILLYDPEAPLNVKKIAIGGKTDPTTIQGTLGKYGEFNRIGSTSKEPRTARGYQYDLTETRAERKDYSVIVPDRLAKLGLADIPRPSPAGDGLLWKIDPKDGTSSSFHLTRPDGSDPRELAQFSNPDKSKIEFGLFDPRWSADGKKFAFLANGLLYVVPLDRK